jgi:hypothetical protein
VRLGAKNNMIAGSYLPGDIGRAAGGIWKGIKSTIGGQNLRRDEYVAPKLDQRQANKDLDYGLQSRSSQGAQLNRFEDQMLGKGPTVAGQQMKYGIAQAQHDAATQAASARGTNRGMALRESLFAGQNAAAQGNRDAALMRAQEQLSAQQQFGNLATAQRTGDTQQRQLSLDAAKAQEQADMQAMGLKQSTDEGNAGRAQKGTGAVLAGIGGAVKGLFSDINAKEDIQPIDPSFAAALKATLKQPEYQPGPAQGQNMLTIGDSQAAGAGARSALIQQQEAGLQPQPEGMSTGGIGGAIGGGMESMGNGLMSSDARSKERIRQLENELDGRPVRVLDQSNPYTAEASRENLAPLHASQYSYKPEFAALIAEQAASMASPEHRPEAAGVAYADAREPRAGIMAQDLEDTPDGKSVVKSTPVGKMLDQKRALSFVMANQAGLDKRLARIEGRK